MPYFIHGGTCPSALFREGLALCGGYWLSAIGYWKQPVADSQQLIANS
jgi:hypothetical protein